MRLSTVISALFITLLLIVSAHGGTTGKITGVVKDKDSGDPLVGANVIVEGQPLGASTDVDGTYIILNVPPGVYSVTVEYIGYQPLRTAGISVSVDLTTRQNFSLSSATLELGEEIIVQADRELVQKDLTSSEARVSAAKIEQLPVVNLEDVIGIQAGVTKGENGEFHIRGGRTSEIAYWVNGVPVTDNFDNSQGIAVENQSVQELQVISGTFNAEYGNAMSGIVNIVTKDGGQDYKASFETFSADYASGNDDLYYNIDDVNATEDYNFAGTVSGPVPLTGGKMTFVASARHFSEEGYRYGANAFTTTGELTIPFEELNQDDPIASFDPVSMNSRQRTTGQAKLTWFAKPTVKFTLEGLGSSEEFQDYDHSFRLVPEANVFKFNDAYSVSFGLNHTLSSRSFYDLKLSYFNREFNEYLYEDPFDSRYQDPALQDAGAFAFKTAGTNLKRFNRITDTYIGKLDFTTQLTNVHLVKAGIEVQYHELFLDDYNLIPAVNENGIIISPFQPAIPTIDQFDRKLYDQSPVQFAIYLQDKIEYESVIINAGIRFDYFDSRGQVPADPQDPDIYNPLLQENQALSFEERQQIWYKDASSKTQISPRLGIAYPITANGTIHFSFGHFLQIPAFNNLYKNPGFKIRTIAGTYGPFGNPDLKPEETIQYELGLQQQILSDYKIDVTAFYRDVRNWVTTSGVITTYIPGATYAMHVNRDYSNVRGVTLSLGKRFRDN